VSDNTKMIRVQGLHFHLRDVEGNRPALVFIHYWGGTGRTWDLVIREMAGRHRCDARDRSGAADESQLAINLETVKSPASPRALSRAGHRCGTGDDIVDGVGSDKSRVASVASAARRAAPAHFASTYSTK
jgi:hypothetical protein